MENVAAETDAVRAEVQGLRTERDQVIHLAESREVARVRTLFAAAR